MNEIPDGVFGKIGAMWDTLGYNPIFVYRLLERGFSMEEIDSSMRRLIGENWAEMKAGNWCDILACRGCIPMQVSLDTDSPPVIDILTAVISLDLEQAYMEEHEDELDYPDEDTPYSEGNA